MKSGILKFQFRFYKLDKFIQVVDIFKFELEAIGKLKKSGLKEGVF